MILLSAALLVAAAPPTVAKLPRLYLAQETSSAPGSTPAVCLMDPACKGSWRPRALDRGRDESVVFNFIEKVPCATVEIDVGAKLDANPFEAAATSADGVTWRAACHESQRVRVTLNGTALVELRAIRLFDKDGARIAVDAPRVVRATVAASSVLEPFAAYQPAFLFDSRSTMAWAADGKKGDGTGSVITIDLEEPVAVGGVLVMNGYQRSAAHYEANGRAAALRVEAGGQVRRYGDMTTNSSRSVSIAPFDTPLPASKRVTVTIDAVVRGSKSKDLVISELHLLDDTGRLVHPAVAVEPARAEGAYAALLDRAYAGVAANAEKPGDGPGTHCSDRRMRLRSSGSMILVGSGGQSEGGWEQKKGALRVFGERIGEAGSDIFDGALVVRPFAALGAAEQAKIIDAIWPMIAEEGLQRSTAVFYGRDGAPLATGTKALAKALAERGALAVSSPVFTDAVLPVDELPPCPPRK